MRVEDNDGIFYVFRSGRSVRTEFGAMAITPQLEVYSGSRSYYGEQEPVPLPSDLTPAEALELGSFMADLWQRYATAAGMEWERRDKAAREREGNKS